MGFQVEDIYQSNSDHLKAEDLGNDMPTYTMQEVSEKTFDNGDRKLIVAFRETPKTLVLNATNAKAIAQLYGGDSDGWFSKQIILFAMPVDYAGKQTMGIRVRAPMNQQPQASNTAQQQNGDPRQNIPPADDYNAYGNQSHGG